MLPQVRADVTVVAATAIGPQPSFLSRVKEPDGKGFTQIVLVFSLIPQKSDPVFTVIEYTPGWVKFTPRNSEPDCQIEGILEEKSLPKFPLVSVQPVAGVIFQIMFPFLHTPLSTVLLLLVFLSVTVVFTHMVSEGEIAKSALGFSET